MKVKSFKFASRWSNHPEGNNTKEWIPSEPPRFIVKEGKTIQLYNEAFEDYLPADAEEQTPVNGYYDYGNGVKVKSQEFGNTSTPFGEYTKKYYFLGLP